MLGEKPFSSKRGCLNGETCHFPFDCFGVFFPLIDDSFSTDLALSLRGAPTDSSPIQIFKNSIQRLQNVINMCDLPPEKRLRLTFEVFLVISSTIVSSSELSVSAGRGE